MNTPNQKEFNRIVRAYLSGRGTPEQNIFVEQYFDLFTDEIDILSETDRKESNEIRDRLKLKIDQNIAHIARPTTQLFSKYITVAAASILILSSITVYYLYPRHSTSTNNLKESIARISPGSNKAVLILSNGKQIDLEGAVKGELADQFGVDIIKTKDGSITYQNANETTTDKLAKNTISTPKGGQYQLVLPDGTHVWLNAASSLTFPVRFNKNLREVKLQGEAYFEVSKRNNQQFTVVTNHQTVEVLGTHFNINDYSDEPVSKVTLLEGSVQVTDNAYLHKAVLKPGQQAAVKWRNRAQPIIVSNIDTEESVAWKNGYFQFEDEPLESVLRKISRWYNVDIKYEKDSYDKISFSGTLSKYSDVKNILRKIEYTGAVKFNIEGRTIMVK